MLGARNGDGRRLAGFVPPIGVGDSQCAWPGRMRPDWGAICACESGYVPVADTGMQQA